MRDMKQHVTRVSQFAHGALGRVAPAAQSGPMRELTNPSQADGRPLGPTALAVLRRAFVGWVPGRVRIRTIPGGLTRQDNGFWSRQMEVQILPRERSQIAI